MIFFGESGEDGEDRFPGFALQYIDGLIKSEIYQQQKMGEYHKHKTG